MLSSRGPQPLSRVSATPEPGPPAPGSSAAWQLSRQDLIPTGQPCPLHPLSANSQPRAGPRPTTQPAPGDRPGRVGRQAGGAGTSFPVFLSDPSPQGKREEGGRGGGGREKNKKLSWKRALEQSGRQKFAFRLAIGNSFFFFSFYYFKFS